MPDITATRPAGGAAIETAWGDQIHDAVEGIQGGTATIAYASGLAQAQLQITFPRPYVVPPAVVVSNANGSITYLHSVGGITTTGFGVNVFRRDGANSASLQNIPVCWIAVPIG